MDSLQERIDSVKRRIREACRRAQRPEDAVQLVAVSKKVRVEHLEEAVSGGLRTFGENRVQEFLQKYQVLGERVEWHLIGHLQRNKARYLVKRIRMIHSLDSLELAATLDRLSKEQGYPWQVLVQVNISGEETKSGLAPGELGDFLDRTREMRGLEIVGLMTMAPICENPEETRPVFRGLRELRDAVQRTRPWINLRHLSMGMTNDFEVAVEEGATLVRIGSALFESFYEKKGG